MRPKWVAFSIFSLLYLPNIDATNCAGTIVLNASTSIKYITTPNYEENETYPPFLDCSFIIKAPDKTRISITILNMDMEPKLFTECIDQVSIFDGSQDVKNSRLGQFCGKTENSEIISKTNTVLVQFKSDELYEFKGANISYQFFDQNTCPFGWISSNLSPSTCLKFSTNYRTDWITAQSNCNSLQSNLVGIDSKEKRDFIFEKFNSTAGKIWLEYHDGTSEGSINAIVEENDSPYYDENNELNDLIADNNDDNDCMTFNFQENGKYEMKNCIDPNFYICEMNQDFSTKPVPPPIKSLQNGSYTKSSQFSLWILLFLIGLLFLLVLGSLCYMCYKQKEKARIHNESASGVNQNAFMSDPPAQTASTRISAINNRESPSESVIANPPSRTSGSKVYPLTKQIPETPENNKTAKRFPASSAPNHLPVIESNEASEADNIVETVILKNETINNPISQLPKVDVSSQPTPQPRTLPPLMPPREATFQSMNTRDGSTVRTRRNKDLFDRPKMHVLDNVSAISLDEFWSNKNS